MANLDLSTVELVSTLRAAPLNGSPSSQDYNDSWTESLADLAALAGFIDDILIPMLNGLISTIQPNPSNAPYGLEGRFIYADTTDNSQVFFNSLAGTSNSIADALRVIESIVETTQTTINSLSVEVSGLQTALSSTNQNDVAQALQNFAAALQSLTAQTVANTQAIAAISVSFLTDNVANGTQNILNLISGSGIELTPGAGGTVTIAVTPVTVVTSLAGLSGVLTLTSSDSSVTITPAGSNIDLTAAPGVTPGSPIGSIQGNNAGAFGGIAGTLVDFTNGMISVAPPNPSSLVQAALTITGDASSNNIQEWYQNGAPGAPVLSVDAYGDLTFGAYAALYLSATGTLLYDSAYSAGTAGQVLSSTGSGVLWVSGGGGGSPGGPTGSVQYNNGGTFTGDTGIAVNYPSPGCKLWVQDNGFDASLAVGGNVYGSDIQDWFINGHTGQADLQVDRYANLIANAGYISPLKGIKDGNTSLGTDGQVLTSQMIGINRSVAWAAPNGGLSRVSVTLLQSDLLNLASAEVQLLPSLTGTSFYNIISVNMRYIANTTGYTVGNNDNQLEIRYGVGSPEPIYHFPAHGFVDGPGSGLFFMSTQMASLPTTSAVSTTNVLGKDIGVFLVGTSAGLTGGDGTVEIIVVYTIETF